MVSRVNKQKKDKNKIKISEIIMKYNEIYINKKNNA